MSAVPENDHDLLIKIAERLDLALRRDDDQESRLRALERKVYLGIGGAGALGSVIGWAMNLVGR